jgi:ABC-2 type transport system permease protein
MTIIPLLLRPSLLALKNRYVWRGTRSLREFIGLLASASMVVAMYLSTYAALEASSQLIESGALDPFMPLSLLLTSLFIMLVLSAAIAGLGSLFLAKDLDLILASPVSLGRFLRGRCSEVALSTGWMVCVFGMPSLLAFGSFFDCGAAFFIMAPILSALAVCIAVLAGVLAALSFGAIISPRRGRTILLLLFMVSLLLFFCSLNSASVTTKLSSTSLAPHLELLRAASQSWTPGRFWARAILDIRNGSFAAAGLALLAACTAAAALWAALWLVASRAYFAAYMRLRNEGDLLKLNSRASQTAARLLLPFVRVDRRALIAKEFKLFARDLSHTIQLAMLLAICFIYLYNFQTLEGPTSMAEEVRVLWQLLLLLVNAALSFLVVTCICSRFVFPSVSMEGTSFWILQSAPVSMRNILRAKVAGWFLPVASISAVIFMSGAMAIGADEPLVLASCAAGVILAYGLVGLGVGLGALFAHFEWEYASQVSTNVGSFLFMGLSVLFLVVSLVPIALSFGAYALAPNILPFSDSPTLILVGGLVVLAIINYACAATALSVGSRSLKAR